MHVEPKKPTMSLTALLPQESHKKREEPEGAKMDVNLARQMISEALSPSLPKQEPENKDIEPGNTE
jgi:hypothetical protein